MNTTEATEGDRPAPLFPGRRTLAQLAVELSPDRPMTELSARRLMDSLKLPYVTIARVRYYDREQVRAAILAGEIRCEPRGRGRPPGSRKHAEQHA